MSNRDTIFATSSGAPPAAIAIIRVSGAAAFAIGSALFGTVPEPRRATVRALRHPHDRTLLDRALILTFAAPRTATGEDLVELHVHGGRAVVAAVEAAIGALPGTRRAEPGEFTRRALENGVIDLIAAEGLGDLLTAETETQRRAALRMVEGGLRVVVDRWTARLIDIAARIEAQLDFSDEDDVADEGLQMVLDDVEALAIEIEDLLREPPVERLHDGLRIVIAGPPNSGKSTLLNALAGRDVAIVSPVSGTTRDRIEAPAVRAGLAYILIDTAGLTDTPGDEIEQIGIGRAEQAIAFADVVLWLDDLKVPAVPNYVWVHARSDIAGREIAPPAADISVSASSGAGIAALWNLIAVRCRTLIPQADALATNRRQRSLLGECLTRLRAARSEPMDALIVAEEVRAALRILDTLTGRSGIEDLFDALFAKFCIGK